jgi:ATP-dependent protease Clp ATPase subunit
MLDIMYDLPTWKGAEACIINEDVIIRKAPPIIHYRESQKQA